MNDDTRAGGANRYGHYAFLQDSSDVVAWMRRHGLEHGVELDEPQNLALQHFQRLHQPAY